MHSTCCLYILMRLFPKWIINIRMFSHRNVFNYFLTDSILQWYFHYIHVSVVLFLLQFVLADCKLKCLFQMKIPFCIAWLITGNCLCVVIGSLTYHIETETKWQPFCKRYLEMHFLDENFFTFIRIIKARWQIYASVKELSFVQEMAGCLCGMKPLLAPMMISYQLDPLGQTSIKFGIKMRYYSFYFIDPWEMWL